MTMAADGSRTPPKNDLKIVLNLWGPDHGKQHACMHDGANRTKS